MRKIVLMAGVSLDGFIEGPDRDIGWHQVDEELHQHMNDVLSAAGGFLSGRVTHQLMADYWPTADADPANAGAVAEFAEIWRSKPKYVYSRTLRSAEWNTTIVRDVVPEEVAALKAAPGGDLTLGGADLATSFLRQDLVDAFRIYVHPVRIGRGTPLFPTLDYRPVTLRHTDTQTFGNGVVLLRYERA
ncbi:MULTISPECIES: dihydrofolate reductase family protein [unclassified Streptomyces]|uniref:dihydrofolate reductase family protein n=1 Tax=unclassified Streptomyces TaxID=2593676 RepID=UPI003800FD51